MELAIKYGISTRNSRNGSVWADLVHGPISELVSMTRKKSVFSEDQFCAAIKNGIVHIGPYLSKHCT